MTIQTLTLRPAARPVTGIWRWLKQRYERRRDRALMQNLAVLDDAMLKDIGVTRGDVYWASQLPLSQNAALELEKISRHSRSQI